MVLEPVISSKAGTIRSLLIRAWRERWSDIQWGIRIKTVLPRYISGDIYHLSDCILQQALMGPLPNNLILSYLRHSLCSQIVSYGGVIESISKYDGLHKPHCVQALLNLMQSMMKSVTCKGKPEDCLMLATSLVGGVKWLVQVMGQATQQLIDLGTAPEHSTNVSLAGSVLLEILNSPFLMCMLEIGRREEINMWNECLKKMADVETLLAGSNVENKKSLISIIWKLREETPLNKLGGRVYFDSTRVPLCYAVHSIVMMEVFNFTSRDASRFVQQILLLQKLKGIRLPDLYFELLRAAFIGLSSTEYQQYQTLNWSGFTFIKLPTIVNAIHVAVSGEMNKSSEDFLFAVKKLAHMTTLLDIADSRINSNGLECLLSEFSTKTSLINDIDAQAVLSIRLQESNVLMIIQNSEGQKPNIADPFVVLRAQPTAKGILKTLENKSPDSVLQVINILISGKSRNLFFAAAAANGALPVFTQKFVMFNEQSLESQPGETNEVAKKRALMFDTSFLILCNIAQVYGIDVVVSEKCETFIEKWMVDSMPEPGNVKFPPDNKQPDTAIIEDFIRQFNTESESIYNMIRWNDTCHIAVMAVREVVCAAQYGSITIQVVKDLINRLCCHLTSLPICVVAWLCSYIHLASGEKAEQPRELLSYLTRLNSNERLSSKLESFDDRLILMAEIIGNMVQVTQGGVQPAIITTAPPSQLAPASAVGSESNSSSSSMGESFQPMEVETELKSEQPLSDLLDKIWRVTFKSHGLISHKTLASCSNLIHLGGTQWFVTSLIKTAMESVFENDLTRAMDIIYGFLHFDVIQCTLTLLTHTLPQYITGAVAENVCEPRSLALARITVMMIASAWSSCVPDSGESGASSAISSPLIRPEVPRKRTAHSRELESIAGKLLPFSAELSVDGASLGLDIGGISLLVAVHSLFKLMAQVSRSGVVSPLTHFIVNFLHELVSAPNTHTLMTLIPSSLLPNLIPLLSPPYAFSYPELLSMTAPQSNKMLNIPVGASMPTPITPAQAASMRQSAAKLLCIQRNLELKSQPKSFGDS